MKIEKLLFTIFIFVFLYSCNSIENKYDKQASSEETLFSKLNYEYSGLDFVNKIIVDNRLNHFRWQSIYNGGGVGTADINNDGLLDIYFCGNMEPDRLYLNKGDFKFEDISVSAGITLANSWSTGVSFADVNGDGFQDIYVCVTKWSRDPKLRTNRLYINQGDNTFKEQAKAFGLDDQGYSMQSTFFDIDNDGDLDMFLCNEPIDTRLSNPKEQAEEKPTIYNSNKLYRQVRKNKFVDVSKASGVWDFSYSLSCTFSDLNQDGLADMYVCNDFNIADNLYYNQGDISFKDRTKQGLNHTSFYSMGSDIADVNNDGLPDIATVDMAGSSHYRSKTNMGSMSNKTFWNNIKKGNHFQYMYNTLQLNNGNQSFSDIAQLAGIAGTDWSWSVLMTDFDNDGYKDISITNGIKNDIRNNDFMDQAFRDMQTMGKKKAMEKALKNLPSTPISNFMYKNNGDLKFIDVSKEWGFYNPGFSNGMAYADFDNDGDMDVVINNVDSKASLYENNSKNHFLKFDLTGTTGNIKSIGAKVKIYYDGKMQYIEVLGTHGYYSYSDTRPNFGLGSVEKIDSAIVLWPGGSEIKLLEVKADQVLSLHIKDATKTTIIPKNVTTGVFKDISKELGLDYIHVENSYDDFLRETLLPYKESQNGPYISIGDVNNDNIDDLFIGNANGTSASLYIGTKSGGYNKKKTVAFEQDKLYEDMESTFLDFDGDGDLDLYVVSGGNEQEEKSPLYQDRLYINSGKGDFVRSKKILPEMLSSGQSVAISDIDEDGDLDIFVGGRLNPGKYPQSSSSYLLLNENGIFKDVTEKQAEGIRNIGMVTKGIFVDIDKDGDKDLVVVGEWMPICFFVNNKGIFSNQTTKSGIQNKTGIWWTIKEGDFDGDGDLDLIAGNLSKNNKFHASAEKPFVVYANDFDNNGTNDVILAKYSGDKQVPVRGRECSSGQLPYIKQKFPTYDKFANASIEEVLPVNKALKLTCTTLANAYIENIGNGKFDFHELPNDFQTAPIRSIVVADYNKDGHLDWMAVGNNFQAEVETTRYDSGTGYVALGNGKGTFKSLSVSRTGFFNNKDCRDIQLSKNGNRLFIASNQSGIQILEMSK